MGVTGSALQQGALQDVQRHAYRLAYFGARLPRYQSAASANPGPCLPRCPHILLDNSPHSS